MDRATRTDVHNPAVRSFNMSRVRAKDTKPEMLVRRGLHAAGLRYRLHSRELPGSPDLVFRGRRALAFVHGCFWHGHDCPLFVLPATRPDFWAAKITGNRSRDIRVATELDNLGWRQLTIWECSLRGHNRRPLGDVIAASSAFLTSDIRSLEIAGYGAATGARS